MNISSLFKGVGLAVLTAALPTLGFAQICPNGVPTSVSDTAAFGPFSGEWNLGGTSTVVPPLELLRFDSTNFPTVPPGATLIRARFLARIILESSGSITNNGDSTCSGNWQARVEATVSAPGIPALNPYLACSKVVQRSAPVGPLAPAGVQNFPFQQQVGHCPTGNATPLEQPVVITDPGLLAPFVGGGTFQVPHFGRTVNLIETSCGTLVNNTVLNARIELFVEYTYCAPGGGGGDCICDGPSPHYRRPGSMLLYPEFDNRAGNVTVVTVTNTKCDFTDGDVRVEIRFINEDDCGEDNFSRDLTACDTFTFLTDSLNPNDKQGYLYIYAKDQQNNPIVWNHLIGSLLVVSGIESFDYSVNPVSFRGIGSATGIEQIAGTFTDLDDDGILDLDGAEYEPAPDIITVPRFLGQDTTVPGEGPGGLFQSQLILIALSGGQAFTTTVDFCIYNDNEVLLSDEWTFYCWDKPYLSDISTIFGNQNLKDFTDHAPNEIFGASGRESGWFSVNGAVASSSVEDIQDPAIYAVLVERVGSYAVADLPWECGVQINGALLPRDLLGDGDPIPVDEDNQ